MSLPRFHVLLTSEQEELVRLKWSLHGTTNGALIAQPRLPKAGEETRIVFAIVSPEAAEEINAIIQREIDKDGMRDKSVRRSKGEMEASIARLRGALLDLPRLGKETHRQTDVA